MKYPNIIFLVLPLILVATLCSCAQNVTAEDSKISVVSTLFPQYDWVRQILGDKADTIESSMLPSDRIDLHNYQPSVDDIVKISNCDLFIYVGGESDEWVTGILKSAQNPDMVVINLMDILGDGIKIDEPVLDDDDDDDHHHHDDDDDGGHEEHEDEHVWLSLKNAGIFCGAIAAALSSLNTEKAGVYESNLTAYLGQLSAVDADYRAALNETPIRALVFADRFPFRYLLDDYGLSYYAAFSGCSAETEASFDTIISLAGKVNDLGLHTVMVTESADKSIANTVIRSTKEKNQQILELNSMQSVTAGDMQNGVTYLSVMESNLNVLREALS